MAARQALKFSIKVYGEGALEVVPAYLLLAEATLGVGGCATVAATRSLRGRSRQRSPPLAHPAQASTTKCRSC